MPRDGVLAETIRQAKADALAKVAEDWQTNMWVDVLVGGKKIANSQRVTDWLRARATELRNGGEQ